MTDASLPSSRRAIVLGGGGIAGIAWHLGVLSELIEQGVDVGSADLVVGTSAGSVAGAILRFGQVPAVYAAQAAAPTPTSPTPPEAQGESAAGAAVSGGASVDMNDFGQRLAEVVSGAGSPEEARARLGQAAIAATEGTESPLIAQLGAQFPALFGWPPAPFAVCVVEAENGAFRIIDSSDGVPLSRAIAARCSVPLVFPPVEIEGVHYIDGGARSATNADVAEGYDRVLVLSCGDEDPRSPMGPQLGEAVAALEDGDGGAPSAVLVVTADDASRAAFGGNSLDDSSRVPSALAGRAQGASVADEVRSFWQA
jgi:NTE family protein